MQPLRDGLREAARAYVPDLYHGPLALSVPTPRDSHGANAGDVCRCGFEVGNRDGTTQEESGTRRVSTQSAGWLRIVAAERRHWIANGGQPLDRASQLMDRAGRGRKLAGALPIRRDHLASRAEARCSDAVAESDQGVLFIVLPHDVDLRVGHDTEKTVHFRPAHSVYVNFECAGDAGVIVVRGRRKIRQGLLLEFEVLVDHAGIADSEHLYRDGLTARGGHHIAKQVDRDCEWRRERVGLIEVEYGVCVVDATSQLHADIVLVFQ